MKIFLYVLILQLIITNIYSQWSGINPPEGIIVNAIAVSDSNIFIGTINNGILRSSDSGNNWLQTTLINQKIISQVSLGNKLFAKTEKGIYVTKDEGRSFSFLKINNLFFECLTALDGNVLGASDDLHYFDDEIPLRTEIITKFYLSGDSAKTWKVTSMFKENFFTPQQIFPVKFLTFRNIIFASTSTGIYLSEDIGKNWNQIFPIYTTLITTDGTNIYAVVKQDFIKSTNMGGNWSRTFFMISKVNTLISIENNILIGCDSGIYISKDGGVSWTQKNEGMKNTIINYLYVMNNNIIAVDKENYIWRRPFKEFLSIQ